MTHTISLKLNRLGQLDAEFECHEPDTAWCRLPAQEPPDFPRGCWFTAPIRTTRPTVRQRNSPRSGGQKGHNHPQTTARRTGHVRPTSPVKRTKHEGRET